MKRKAAIPRDKPRELITEYNMFCLAFLMAMFI
jgi:hypothetical protein